MEETAPPSLHHTVAIFVGVLSFDLAHGLVCLVQTLPAFLAVIEWMASVENNRLDRAGICSVPVCVKL